MYHEITAEPSTSGFQRRGARAYACHPRLFDGHLRTIAASGCEPSLVSTLAPAPGSGAGDAGTTLLLSFDDGGASALAAADALARRQWRGHFFIVTNRIGTRGFLSRDEIRYLRSCGHLVGSHSHTHPDIFPGLTAARMREEWGTSRRILEDVLGEPCHVASVPGGDLSNAVVAAAEASGIDILFTSEPELHPRRVGQCLLVGRYAVKAGLAPTTLAALLALRGWQRARLYRRWSVIARRGLGPLYRLYVDRTTATDRAPGCSL
jgi:peptidoglycan/xylan/chitin deacetylase (PgdA/CDA1 family)